MGVGRRVPEVRLWLGNGDGSPLASEARKKRARKIVTHMRKTRMLNGSLRLFMRGLLETERCHSRL
jgi:hypothetical protein